MTEVWGASEPFHVAEKVAGLKTYQPRELAIVIGRQR
jgi:hypothetical protein